MPSFKFWSRQTTEVIFVGDEVLISKAHRELNDTRSNHSQEGTPTTSRHTLQIGRRTIEAIFHPTADYRDFERQIREITASRNSNYLIVVLCDINTQIEIPKLFVEEICTFGGSVLWLTGVWNSNSVHEITETESTEPIYIPNLEQKKKEIELRNATLKLSLIRGARYARWSEDQYSESLRIPLQELVENKDLNPNLVRKLNSFKFTDADTGEEIVGPLELSEDDLIFAVVGQTGAGKSTFIKNSTGYNLPTADELLSCTSEIHIIRVTSEGSRIYVVDTPGFNDTNRSDLEIFELISQPLKQRFTNQVYLSGLIYLHRISDNRMTETTLKNLNILEELCGKGCFHKITIATNMWEDVETQEIGEQRERQLKADYFSAMLNRGAGFRRLLHTEESAKELLGITVANAKEMQSLSLHKEISGLKKGLPSTRAGQKMYDKLGEVLRRHQATLAQLNRDIRAEPSEQVRLILAKDRQDLNQELLALVADMQYMKLPLPTRLLLQVKRFLGITT